MFPNRYFNGRYFAPRYFAKVGATPVVPDFWNAMTGESGFTGGGDIEEWLRSIIPFIILVNYVL